MTGDDHHRRWLRALQYGGRMPDEAALDQLLEVVRELMRWRAAVRKPG